MDTKVWNLPLFCETIHSVKFVGSWKGPFVPADRDVVVRALVACCGCQELPGCWNMPGRERGRWSRGGSRCVSYLVWGYGHRCVEAASCLVSWAWPPESWGSRPWCSVVPMTPKTGRSGPSVLTGWMSLNVTDHWLIVTDDCWLGAVSFIQILLGGA
jgi:hypothetical protein